MSNTPTTIGAAPGSYTNAVDALRNGGSKQKILYKAGKGFYVRKGVQKLTGKFADLRDKDAAKKKRNDAIARLKGFPLGGKIYEAAKGVEDSEYGKLGKSVEEIVASGSFSQDNLDKLIEADHFIKGNRGRFITLEFKNFLASLGNPAPGDERSYLTGLRSIAGDLGVSATDNTDVVAIYGRMLRAYEKAREEDLPEEKLLERLQIAALAQNFEDRVKAARGGSLTNSDVKGIAAMEQAASDLPFYSQLTKDQQIKAWGATSTETSKLSGDDLDRTSAEIWASTLSNDEKIQGVQEWLQIELDQMGGNNTGVGAIFLRNMKYPASKDQAERDKQIKIFKGSTIFNVAFQGSYLNVIESELKMVKASKGLTGHAFIESFSKIFDRSEVKNIDENFCALFAAGMNKIDEQNGLSDTTKSDLKKKLGVQIALKLIAPKFSIPDNREAVKFGSLLQKFANLPNADEKSGIGDEQAKQLNDKYLAFVAAIVERGNANRTPVQSV